MFDVMLPKSIDSEQTVLGGMILNKLQDEKVLTAFEGLIAEDFYDKKHQEIFSSVSQLVSQDKPVELPALADALPDMVEYLTVLISNSPGWGTIDFYAKIVKQKSVERRMIKAMQEAIQILSSRMEHADKVDQANKLMSDVDGHITKQKGAWIKDMINPVINRIDGLLNKKDVSGYKTGFDDLDRVIGGFEPGELITLGARTSVGKSTLAMNMAENIAKHGHNVLYLSFEMSPEELTGRVICSQGRADNLILRNPSSVSQGEWSKFSAGSLKASEMPIMVEEIGSPTVDQVVQAARAFNRKHGLKFLVVDHLHLMSHKGKSEVDGIADTTKRLKGLAVELNVPVLLVAQLNRGSAKENRQPVITDLRGSGAIEQDSNRILLIHRDQEAMPNQALLYIAKNRNGQANVGVTMAESLAYFRFDNAAHSYREEY